MNVDTPDLCLASFVIATALRRVAVGVERVVACRPASTPAGRIERFAIPFNIPFLNKLLRTRSRPHYPATPHPRSPP